MDTGEKMKVFSLKVRKAKNTMTKISVKLYFYLEEACLVLEFRGS